MIVATTRGALLRGTTEDALGDEVDALVEVVGFEDFAASLIERDRREFDEASNTWRTVRYFAGRFPGNVPAVVGDVFRDARDAKLYRIVEVESMPRGLSGRSSVTLTMKRASP